jgi:hypothetical protein
VGKENYLRRLVRRGPRRLTGDRTLPAGRHQDPDGEGPWRGEDSGGDQSSLELCVNRRGDRETSPAAGNWGGKVAAGGRAREEEEGVGEKRGE